MVIRRAARFGSKIGFDQPFLADVAEAVIEHMGGHYTELVEKREAIRQSITLEEERFRRTLDRGVAELEDALDRLAAENKQVLPGTVAFYLKATLGLPIEVIRDICQERGFSVDEADSTPKSKNTYSPAVAARRWASSTPPEPTRTSWTVWWRKTCYRRLASHTILTTRPRSKATCWP